MDNFLQIYDILAKEYPKAKTALIFSNAWQMLVSTILSAQCTDKRVNEITKVLFKKYPVIEDYVNMSGEELIRYIKPAGFFNNKSRNILSAAKKIKENFNGKIPDTMDDMLSIPGVARKTANVVLGNAYGIVAGIAVDTHVKRLAFRLGFTTKTDPVKIETDLMNLFPKEKWHNLTYILIEHGRTVCKAQNPMCSSCTNSSLCPKTGLK